MGNFKLKKTEKARRDKRGKNIQVCNIVNYFQQSINYWKVLFFKKNKAMANFLPYCCQENKDMSMM